MDNRAYILEKANALFLQFGIRSVSMDDISNNLGMSKKTLYHYFTDKDELVNEVVHLHIESLQEDCHKTRKEAKNAIQEVFIAMDRIVELLGSMNPMLLYDLEKFHFKAFRKFRDYKEKFLAQLVRENIEWGIKEELYRPEINVEVISKFRIESMMIAFNASLFPSSKYELATTSEIIMEHFVYGLATMKGYKFIQKYNDQRKKAKQHEEAGK